MRDDGCPNLANIDQTPINFDQLVRNSAELSQTLASQISTKVGHLSTTFCKSSNEVGQNLTFGRCSSQEVSCDREPTRCLMLSVSDETQSTVNVGTRDLRNVRAASGEVPTASQGNARNHTGGRYVLAMAAVTIASPRGSDLGNRNGNRPVNTGMPGARRGETREVTLGSPKKQAMDAQETNIGRIWRSTLGPQINPRSRK